MDAMSTAINPRYSVLPNDGLIFSPVDSWIMDAK